jgi:hypothetical protein
MTSTATSTYTADRLECASRRMRLRGSLGAGTTSSQPRLIIEWDRTPENDIITAYKVKILNNQNEFVEHATCDVEAALAMEVADLITKPKCAIPMSAFWSGDLQMDQGLPITIQILAKNDKGWSLASRWNTSGAVVEKKPGMMNPPEGKRMLDNNNVVITWAAMTSPRNGGSDIITYIL